MILRNSSFVISMLLWAPIAYEEVSAAQSLDNWSFAVSGDSRNCGDIVMPGIAAGVRADNAQLCWHLGDYRANYDFDQDLLAAAEYRGKHLAIADYQQLESTRAIKMRFD